jgi:hypothetical protein
VLILHNIGINLVVTTPPSPLQGYIFWQYKNSDGVYQKVKILSDTGSYIQAQVKK